MYAIDERDRVEKLSEFPQMDTGAPEPRIWWNEGGLALAYRCVESSLVEGANTCIVTAQGADLMAGWPNEEVLLAHPLYGRGLRSYDVYRVVNSSWIRKMSQGNSIHPRHSPKLFNDRTHLVFAFHDSTIEMMVRSYRIETSPMEVEDVLRLAPR